MEGGASGCDARPETGVRAGARSAGTMTQASAIGLPCAACKQPVIEKRTLDGALVVLDAATKRVHLCVKRKEVEIAKAKQIAATRSKASVRPAPRPSVKRPVVVATQTDAARESRHQKQRGQRGERPRQPVQARTAESPRKAAKQRPRKTTLRSPEQVTEMLKGPVTRWRTGD